MSILIAPSILSADFANLEREVGKLVTADYVHVDVMDNHFVPNLTIGLPVVQRLAAVSPVPLDVHLMIDDPDRWAPEFAVAIAMPQSGTSGPGSGARTPWRAPSVTFHAEAAVAPIRLARELRRLGVRAGIAVRPASPVEPIMDLLDEFDMILVMTVEPGFGGQSFIEGMLPKIRQARAEIRASGKNVWIQVDGGVSRETIARVADAGANVFVAGSAVFGATDVPGEISALRALADAAYG
jgi:ribulose-phosphate 3-epimerase